MVSTCVPSSFEAQSSITVCFGATALGEFPIALMYFFTPSKVDKLGTDIKPAKKSCRSRAIQVHICQSTLKVMLFIFGTHFNT